MTVIARAIQGLQRQTRTQVVSVVTIGLALFVLAVAVLALENAGALSARWGTPARMTVYLSDAASTTQVESLRATLATFAEVAEARYVSPGEARATVAANGNDTSLASASLDLFPATIELQLAPGATSPERIQSLGDHVRRLPMVTDVETYRGLTEQLQSVIRTVTFALIALALVVLACAIAVVANTVRLSLHARMREVEVLRLVGASPRYVRAPLLIEGVLLGGGGALLALFSLGVVFVWFREHFESAFTLLLGMRPVFLSVWAATLVVFGGGVLGASGSALAMRRWLRP